MMKKYIGNHFHKTFKANYQFINQLNLANTKNFILQQTVLIVAPHTNLQSKLSINRPPARSLFRAIVSQSTTAMSKKFILPFAYNLQSKYQSTNQSNIARTEKFILQQTVLIFVQHTNLQSIISIHQSIKHSKN
jgi:hypothetical protein